MPMQRSTAKKLVSESEFKLINESFPPLVGALSDKALLQRMERTRKARDRYRTMAERQRDKASSGASRNGTPAAKLKEVSSKEKIFEETLARFERQTAKAGNGAGMKAASSRKTASKPAAKAAKSVAATKKTAAQKTAGRMTKHASPDKAKAAASKSSGMKGGVKTSAQEAIGKKSGMAKSGAQGTSKASVKMANKAAAKSGAKPAAKAGKGKGGATKRVPRGRHGALVASTTLH